MRNFASINILHYLSGIQLQTIPEIAGSEDDARHQFSKLAEIISVMDKDNHSIVLDTTSGYVSLTRKFLSDCILTLKVKFEEEVNDNVS